MNLVGYVRASTDLQALSLSDQRKKLIAYCDLNDHVLVDVIVDEGKSAKDTERPGFQQALLMMRVGEADGMLVTKLDRLTRSVVDLGKLVEEYFNPDTKGRPFPTKSLHSVGDMIDTSSATGRMIMNIIVTMAQWERERTVERVKDALAEVKAQGGVIGPSPFGKKRSDELDEHGRRKVVVDEREAEAIVKINEMWEGGWSVRGMAHELSRLGIRTKKGKRWHATQVQRIINQIRSVRAA